MASDSTVNAILDTAEQLFAERGYDAVSIREITRQADVNVAAVHYHFGSKESVLRGVASRVVGAIIERRRDLLDRLVARERTPSLDAVVRAFIRPDIEVLQELHERGPTVARFLGRLYLDQTPWIQKMAVEQFAPSAAAFMNHIEAATPHLDRNTIERRMQRVGVVLAHAFATWPESGMADDEAEKVLEELVAFCSGAMEAEVRAPSDH